LKIQEILKSDFLPVLTGLYENPHLIMDMRGNILFSNTAAQEFLLLSRSPGNIFDVFTGQTSELFYSLLKEQSREK